MRKLVGVVFAASVLSQMPGPQSESEHLELAAAIKKLVPTAISWTLREANDIMRLPVDREVFVDLPASATAGRVGRHQSMYCSRANTESSWSCDRERTLVAVAPPADFALRAGQCAPVDNGIDVDGQVPDDVIPDLTDFVRFNGETRALIERTCGWKDRTFPQPASCDVDRIRRIAPDSFQVSIRMGPYSWRYVRVAKDCTVDDCTLRLLGCDGWDY